MVTKNSILILCMICLAIMLCISSCDNDDEKNVDQVEYIISLGGSTNKVLAGIDRIDDYDYDNRHIMVSLENNNSLNISPKIAGRTQIEVYYNKDDIKRIDVVTPSDIFVIECFSLEIKVNDCNVSETIKEEIKMGAFTSYSEFLFDRDSIFTFAKVDEDVREETMRGIYHFDESKVEIDTPQKEYIYEYVVNYKNIQDNNVFIEDFTDYYKEKYPDIEIESVYCIYKVVKQILPG